ncbi:hypothetical protein [Amycolatopsis sp. NPDC051061]|uniref:hypothetical protein n=1 Tax=Amycolatopsis sp. NPDC051061 TaxID=3155042 RepID=UPI00342B527A
MAHVLVDWPTCDVPDGPCPGIRVEGFHQCLAHLSETDRSLFLSRLDPGADVDARGVFLSEELMAELVEAVGHFGDLNFTRANFENVDKLGPLIAHRLVLDGATFTRGVDIEVQAAWVSCVATRFEKGVTLRVNSALIDAERVLLGAPSTIMDVGVGDPSAMERLAWYPAWDKQRQDSGMIGVAALVSLRGTDVSNLVLVDVDLRWCLFAGAHRLDQLRFEGNCWFDSLTVRWPVTQRTMLAEEYLERWTMDRHPFVADHAMVPVERVAGLYRSLRKALEDSKNEAGAGDFYYGEMEARRRYPGTPWAERKILRAYWLLSGYGQRAGRAIAAMCVLLSMVTVLLFTVGLPATQVGTWPRIDQSLRIAMGAVVFRDSGQQLTEAGAWTVMIARFVGPVLLALAVLAVRARVKR